MSAYSSTVKQMLAFVGIICLLASAGNHLLEPTNNRQSSASGDGGNRTTQALYLPDVPSVKPRPAVQSLQPEPAPPPPPPKPEPAPQPTAPNCAKVQCVALTFDDGPSSHTPRLLDLLDKTQVKATFFMLGVYVERHADIVRRVAKAGHQIGNHTWSHGNLTTMADDEIVSEMNRTHEVITRVAGVEPVIMRPPFGATDERVRHLVTLPQVLWNTDSYDWHDKEAGLTADRVISGAKQGAIILVHDIYPSTTDAMPRIIDTLRGKGYQFVTIAELFGGQLKPGTYWSQNEFTVY